MLKAFVLTLSLMLMGINAGWASGSAAPGTVRPEFRQVLSERSALDPAPVLDFDPHSWAQAAERAEADGALGVDIQALAELNTDAHNVWQRWLECNGGDVRPMRSGYLTGKDFCTVTPDRGAAVKKSLRELAGSVHAFLATSWVAGSDLDEKYHLPTELGVFNPLIIEFLIEEIAAQPVFIEDMGKKQPRLDEVIILKDRAGHDVLIGNWSLRNALELLSLVPNTDRGSWSLFPALPANVLNSIAVSPVLDELTPTHNGSYRSNVGDIRELISFDVAKKIFSRLGEPHWGDDLFEQPQATLDFLRSRNLTP